MSSYYISPHFDDAIGSCGGKIYLDYISQNKPTIITVFSKAKEPFSEYAENLHKYWGLKKPLIERQKENIKACKKIKAIPMNLGYEDAIYRTDNNKYLYPKDGSIFKNIQKEDKKLINKITNDIKFITTKEDVLYFPLGVGNHVDHIITNMVGHQLKKEGYNIKYYVDFSYKGDIPEKYRKHETLFLTNKMIKKKTKAMKQYKSQIVMLFESKNKIFDYYKKKLKGEETYYE